MWAAVMRAPLTRPIPNQAVPRPKTVAMRRVSVTQYVQYGSLPQTIAWPTAASTKIASDAASAVNLTTSPTDCGPEITGSVPLVRSGARAIDMAVSSFAYADWRRLSASARDSLHAEVGAPR